MGNSVRSSSFRAKNYFFYELITENLEVRGYGELCTALFDYCVDTGD